MLLLQLQLEHHKHIGSALLKEKKNTTSQSESQQGDVKTSTYGIYNITLLSAWPG